MVTTVTNYTDPRNRANVGESYDGVVRISVDGYYGTGVLLHDGRAILTAAHLFSEENTSANIRFETAAGIQTISSSKVRIHPGYDLVNQNNDLALVWVSASPPIQAERYDLYRDSDEIGQLMTLIGYGTPGTGANGTLPTYSDDAVRLKAINQFDADIGNLKSYLGATMAWAPVTGTQLVADFDDGTTAHDALGILMNSNGTGLGISEGLTAPGDSGGPAFINGQVAGIASYTASLGSLGGVDPDIDEQNNSSFGEIAAWQRVSYYQQWIDQSLRTNYPNAPVNKEEVEKEIIEGSRDTSFTYFLLKFNGVRSDPNQLISVNYATRDGTAMAGEDYLSVSGSLVLYPHENQAVIPVEIIGDSVSEPNEIFYLDVTPPEGISFGEDIVKLTAARTIINDDGGIWG